MDETESGASLEDLKRRCAIASKLWGRIFAGLGAMTYREKGHDALHRLYRDVLSRHQGGHYHEGLRKLGIDPETEPPAVVAAKYHYLSNQLGGLPMEYAEESPHKVWIRYLPPDWTYQGVALLAMPADLGRTIYGVWHPKNGQFMGCPRLGYVATKLVTRGEPCDEGYFYEYDHDLAPDEVMRYEVAERTPEFDPATAPRLDPVAWPAARLVKAQRNYAGEYVRTATEALIDAQGEVAACDLVRQTLRYLAVQFTHELQADLGQQGAGLDAVVDLYAGLLHACFQDYTVERDGASRRRIVLESFKPFAVDAPEHLRAALFHFQTTGARILNGRLRVMREMDRAGREIWDFEDTGRWLY